MKSRAVSELTIHWRATGHLRLILFVTLLLGAVPVRAQTALDLEKLFLAGKYDDCALAAAEVIEKGSRDEGVWLWCIQSNFTRGRYDEARKILDAGLSRLTFSIRLRLAGYEICRKSGDVERSDALVHEIEALVSRSSWRYSNAVDRVALGRAALMLGADPRQVLEVFYDRARKDKPDLRDVYLATGELAIQKGDDALAAKTFQEALEQFNADPDMHYGIARAFAASDPRRTAAAIETALQHNPSHIPSLLYLADHQIDAEQYEAAERTLERVLAVNSGQAEAWSYRAALAHLAGDSTRETECRAMALQWWPTDPGVDHLIGRKLSQKYRFAEGAEYQRRALKSDPQHNPAKIQLAQDLLRLGLEDEGWRLAEQVHERDRFDITAYNLVTLHDTIAPYCMLSDGPIRVRMEPREADLYGDRVLRLLRRAYETLGNKYELALDDPVMVEIFPHQNDFAVRTFGMPGGAGYLGVCFGKVVTANSPASQGDSPTSWESVLWHEFCHVVTLQLTRNKMPRWLSEGISVYEERQADPAWGQGMTPQYRAMIAEGELTPLGQLSGAFLAPPSALHLQFAYFESSLVVEFLVEEFGASIIRNVLTDLSAGVAINASLEKHSGKPIAELEAQFAAFAERRANELAPAADLSRDELPKPGPELAARTAAWLETHPTNVWAQIQLGAARIRDRQFDEAVAPLRRAVELFPNYAGPDNAYWLLATVYREQSKASDELAVLRELVRLDADAVPALLRLIELDVAATDWPAAARDAERLMAVNPLLPHPHRARARAAEALDDRTEAIAAYRRVLLLDPEDPAEVHFRLARLLYAAGDPTAKRHVLLALEDAPRFADALRLLLQIIETETSEQPPTKGK